MLDFPQRRERPGTAPGMPRIEENVDAAQSGRYAVRKADCHEIRSRPVLNLHRIRRRIIKKRDERLRSVAHPTVVLMRKISLIQRVRLPRWARWTDLNLKICVPAPHPSLRPARQKRRRRHAQRPTGLTSGTLRTVDQPPRPPMIQTQQPIVRRRQQRQLRGKLLPDQAGRPIGKVRTRRPPSGRVRFDAARMRDRFLTLLRHHRILRPRRPLRNSRRAAIPQR